MEVDPAASAQPPKSVEKVGRSPKIRPTRPLGSTVALLDSTQTITDTWEYWPYGEVRTQTGTNETPFQWVGVWGYYKTPGLTYVRARSYQQTTGKWTTIDPVWSNIEAYSYSRSSPISLSDCSGKWPGENWIEEIQGRFGCGTAKNCILAGGCRCKDREIGDPNVFCFIQGIEEIPCCADFDGDHVGHIILVEVELCACYFAGCGIVPGSSNYPVPTGAWRYFRDKQGRLKACHLDRLVEN